VEKRSRARQATDGNHMRFICRIGEARTDTHSEHVILMALPRQEWIPERTSLLLYKYIALCKFTRGCMNLCKSLTSFISCSCPFRAFLHKSCLQYTNKMHIHNKIHVLVIILSSTCFADYCSIFREKFFYICSYI